LYICNCNGLRERDVNAALNEGAACPKTVHAHHGCAMQCGRCMDEIEDIISERRCATLNPAMFMPATV
jgi:bacterioferritin-associated ferredoxin